LSNLSHLRDTEERKIHLQAVWGFILYTAGNPNFPDERAGNNDSDKDNYVNSDGGWDNFFRLRFKYLLPIGHGKDQIITTQVVDRGLLVDGATGGESWSPFESGLTYLEIKPFYPAEMRFIPRWNPFDGWPWLQKYLGVQWLQFVLFFEIGRVAPVWNVQKLHEDMKWSAGLGVRFWAKGLVARIDSAVSDEGFAVQMMVG